MGWFAETAGLVFSRPPMQPRALRNSQCFADASGLPHQDRRVASKAAGSPGATGHQNRRAGQPSALALSRASLQSRQGRRQHTYVVEERRIGVPSRRQTKNAQLQLRGRWEFAPHPRQFGSRGLTRAVVPECENVELQMARDGGPTQTGLPALKLTPPVEWARRADMR